MLNNFFFGNSRHRDECRQLDQLSPSSERLLISSSGYACLCFANASGGAAAADVEKPGFLVLGSSYLKPVRARRAMNAWEGEGEQVCGQVFQGGRGLKKKMKGKRKTGDSATFPEACV